MEERSGNSSSPPNKDNITASEMIPPLEISNQDAIRSDNRIEMQEVAPPVPRRKRMASKSKKFLMVGGSSRTGTAKKPIVFYFHILEKDGRKASIPRRDFVCPYCNGPGYDGKTDEGLWFHLKTVHEDKFNFRAARTQDGMLHIAAAKAGVRKRGRESEEALSNMPLPPKLPRSPQEGVQLPIRKYYHPGSFQEIKTGEWLLDIDSDDEIEESWKKELVDSLLDEFEDVSSEEKRFFKLWNEFIEQLNLVPQNSLPGHCMTFVNKHASFLHQEKLEEQLILHLTNMWHEGHIGREHLLGAMTKYHEIVSGASEDTPTLSSVTNVNQR